MQIPFSIFMQFLTSLVTSKALIVSKVLIMAWQLTVFLSIELIVMVTISIEMSFTTINSGIPIWVQSLASFIYECKLNKRERNNRLTNIYQQPDFNISITTTSDTNS